MKTHPFLSQFLVRKYLPNGDGEISTVLVACKFCGAISSYKSVLKSVFKKVVFPNPDSPALTQLYLPP
jgi:hypothetical protein